MTRAGSPHDPDDSLEALRAMVERATQASSLRHVAGMIGISKEGLRAFLSGRTVPQTRTRRKLETWCRTQSQRGEERPVSARRRERLSEPEALANLLALLPAPVRESAAGQIRKVMARSYRAAGAPVPPWADDGLGN